MLLQWIDYHIMQGFDHFYLYDHIIDRDDDKEYQHFFNLLFNSKQNYNYSKYVTLIEWPVTVKNGEIWGFQISAENDCLRRFRYQCNYIAMLDIDELYLPVPKNYNNPKQASMIKSLPTVKELLFEHYQGSFNYLKRWTLMGLPNIMESIKKGDNYHTENSDTNMHSGYSVMVDYNHNSHLSLGCNLSDSSNMFDTFLERNWCIHKQIENKYFIKLFNNLLNISAYSQSDIDKDYEAWRQKIWYKLIDSGLQSKLAATNEKVNLNHSVSSVEKFILQHLSHFANKRRYFEQHITSLDEKNSLLMQHKDDKTWMLKNDDLSLEWLKYNSKFSKIEKEWIKWILFFDLNIASYGGGYQKDKKIMIDPRISYNGYRHKISNLIENQDNDNFGVFNVPFVNFTDKSQPIWFNENAYGKYDNEEIKYEYWKYKKSQDYSLIILHTSDHWRLQLLMSNVNRVVNVSSEYDMYLFYNMTQSSCAHKQSVLFWHKRFLNYTQQQYIYKKKIKPLCDKRGVFCYLNDKNWQNKVPEE